MDARQRTLEQLISLYRGMTQEQRQRFDESAMSAIARLDNAESLIDQGGQERGGGVL